MPLSSVSWVIKTNNNKKKMVECMDDLQMNPGYCRSTYTSSRSYIVRLHSGRQTVPEFFQYSNVQCWKMIYEFLLVSGF